MATTRAKPGGICEVPAGGEVEFLAGFPVEALPGVGPARAALLQQVGVRTVRELCAVDRELLRASFGAAGDELWRRCRGLDDAPVQATPTLRSIARETSFAPAAHAAGQQLPFLRAMLAYLLDRAASELRRQRLLARVVQVRLRHVDGVTGERARTLPEPTDRTDALTAVARDLLVGVTLTGLAPPRPAQGALFGDGGETARRRLFAAVDAVRARHGFGALVVGEATGLLGVLPAGPHGFRLRTPSLTK
jgi:DNA polymerase-4